MRDIMYFIEKVFQAQHSGWVTFLLVLLVIVLAFVLSPSAGAKILELLFIKRKKPGKGKLTKKYFLNHPIYDYLSYKLERLRSLDFGSVGKTNAIRDLLYLKFTIYRSEIRVFIREGLTTTDKFEFKNLVHETILKAEEVYEKQWHNLNIDLLDELIKDYNKWHSQSSAFARVAICNITNSDIYDNTLERMQEILCILETKFRVTMPDIEKGLTDANGKYKNLLYKSIYF